MGDVEKGGVDAEDDAEKGADGEEEEKEDEDKLDTSTKPPRPLASLSELEKGFGGVRPSGVNRPQAETATRPRDIEADGERAFPGTSLPN